MGKLPSAGSVESYRRDGFLPPIRIFPPEETQKLRDHFEAFEAEHGKVFSENRATAGMAFTGSYRFKSHLLMKWLANVIRHPKILDAVEDLIGPDLLCWTTHWFVKEASSPQYVSWHQDSNYWGLDTTELVSVWLALSPSTIESGCARFAGKDELLAAIGTAHHAGLGVVHLDAPADRSAGARVQVRWVFHEVPW